ncbi:MAG: HAMP domain-containing sensor histidine kinase [bacterium]|nr:HAMP domain-containing sensor histidine kinase [bacterium]
MIYPENTTRRNQFGSFLRRLFGSADTPPPHFSKFAEFGKGASGIIHDLSNPLTVLSLSIEQLRNAGIENRKARKYIETAERASRKMKLFLSDVKRQLSDKETKKRFDASFEIKGAIKLLRSIARESKVKIKFRPNQAVFLCGDQVKFWRVVSNIISNAVDSYADFPPNQNKLVIVRIKKDRKTVRLSVRDFGCGIPKHLHKAIFEPFYTTKQKHEGVAGLGLSIVKNIIENDFAGKIKVESIPGRGSTFTFVIPKN